MNPTILLADIGGTNTRIARSGLDGAPFDVRVEANDDYGGLEELFGAYLSSLGEEKPHAGVFAIAGPVSGDDVQLTNRPWAFNRLSLAKTLGLDALVVLNDFAALAQGVPTLGPEHLVRVGTGHANKQAPILVCGPGTGLGTATLLPQADGGGYDVVPGEGGHVRLGAVTADEARIIGHFERETGPVTVEHVLSGPGLVRLHRLLAGETLTSHAIIEAAVGGSERELETCNVFLRLLGRIAGDYSLLVMARGGVYIAGGVGAAMAPLFAASPFRDAFEAHPPYHDQLANFPVHVVVHPTPGLRGTAQVGRRLLASLS